MSNPRLDPDQLQIANRLIDEVRARLDALTGGDKEYYWALRRKLAKELVYDERGKTSHRVKLKARKMEEQKGICPICEKKLPSQYCVLDRFEAIRGYTMDNTRLICQECDYAIQRERGYK
jgi:hypothetical protein